MKKILAPKIFVSVVMLVGLSMAAVWWLLPGMADAATVSNSSVAQPSLTVQANEVPGKAVATVSAVLTPLYSPTGASMVPPGAKAYFYVHLTQFQSSPLLLLGSSPLNSGGAAQISYQPTWKGQQQVVVEVENSVGKSLYQGSTSFVATRFVTPFKGAVEAIRPDGGIGRAVVVALLTIVALVWIALLATAVRVNLGMGMNASQKTVSV